MWNNIALSLKPFTKDFDGDQVVKTLSSNAGSVGSIPGWGTKIPHDQKAKQKQIIDNKNNVVTNSTKTLKMVPVKKKRSLLKNVKTFHEHQSSHL